MEIRVEKKLAMKKAMVKKSAAKKD